MTELHDTLVEFVQVLRTADVKVSPAETLDAMETLDIIGIENRVLLKNSLSMVLSKNPEEKKAFNTSFDRFFPSTSSPPKIMQWNQTKIPTRMMESLTPSQTPQTSKAARAANVAARGVGVALKLLESSTLNNSRLNQNWASSCFPVTEWKS